jgi:hypothetical protein
MAKKSKTKTTEKKNASTPKDELKSIKIKVNQYGEIIKDVNIDQINAFLNDHVPDKKFE